MQIVDLFVEFLRTNHYISMMWINRHYTEMVLKMAKAYPALVLTGPRQAGKTSLLRHIFPHADYISLDYPQFAEEAENNPQHFLARFKHQVIIDEYTIHSYPVPPS